MIQYFAGLLNVILKSAMNYTAAKYFLLVAATVLVYFIFPKKHRWMVLLAASGYFYYAVSSRKLQLVIFAASILFSYGAALLLKKVRDGSGEGSKTKIKSRIILWTGILISAAPLIASKLGDLIVGSVFRGNLVEWIIPIGLSFYSMQIIAYLVDIYRGKIEPEKNVFKYALFISFFPIIIQGPISRFSQLRDQLMEGHSFDGKRLMRGIQLILWGLFLKLMIADKASILVDAVFDQYKDYAGFFILVAAIFYSIQLYTDFMSCVTISRGVAELFGIELVNNFKRPYFSCSIKDFWRRWHISLSEWLRDYVYISLGGNRKGKLHKWKNLVVTFFVSGLWHGGSFKYIAWGLMHAAYQIIGELMSKPKNYIMEKLAMPRGSRVRVWVERLGTFLLVMIAWIIFRAGSLEAGLHMIGSMFSAFNPWVFFDDSLYALGITGKDMAVFFLSLGLLMGVSTLQEKGVGIRAWFSRQNTVIRWGIYFGLIWGMWIFGAYGYGFSAADFIYGGF